LGEARLGAHLGGRGLKFKSRNPCEWPESANQVGFGVNSWVPPIREQRKGDRGLNNRKRKQIRREAKH